MTTQIPAEPKPGLFTTEFGALAALFAAIPLDPSNARWYVAGFVAYAIMRTLLKWLSSREAARATEGGAA